MNRRSFLRLAGLGSTFLALDRLPLLAPLPREARAAGAGAGAGGILDAGERETLGALIDRIADTGVEGAPAPVDLDVIGRVERMLSQLEPELVASIRTAISFVDWYPATAGFRFKRFRSLSPAEQIQSLDGWRASRIETRRRVFHALRSIALYAYWSHPDTWHLIGYAGPWLAPRA